MNDLERLDTDLTYEAAVALDERIDDWHSDGRELAIAAYKGRIWLQLGFASWDAYCEKRRAVFAPALDRAERREAVGEMRDAGMSMPAIGSALGVSVGTVHSDAKAFSSERVGEPPSTIGTDGKEYPSKQPPRPPVNPFTPPVLDDPEPEEDRPVRAPYQRPALSTDPAVVEAAHLKRVSDDLRSIVTTCVEWLAQPQNQEKYARLYVPLAPNIGERVPVTAANIRAAAAALNAFADTWEGMHETEI